MDDDHCERCDAPIALDLLIDYPSHGLCEDCAEVGDDDFGA